MIAGAPISESSGSLQDPSEFSKCLLVYMNGNSTQSHKVSKECAEMHEQIRGTIGVIYGQIKKNLNDVLVNKSEVNCLVDTFRHHKFLETNIVMTTAHLTNGFDQEKLLKEVYDKSKMIFTIAAMKCIMSEQMVLEIVADFSTKVKVDGQEFECIKSSLEKEEEEARMNGRGDALSETVDVTEEITTANYDEPTTEVTTLAEEEEDLTTLNGNEAATYETDEILAEPTTVSNFEQEETEEITSTDDDTETTTHDADSEADSEFTTDPIFDQLSAATSNDDYETIIEDDANEIIDDITEMSPIDIFTEASSFESSTIFDDEQFPTEAQTDSTDTFIINNEILKLSTPEDSVETSEGNQRVKKSAGIPPTPYDEPCKSKLQAVRDRIRKFEFTSLDDQQNHCVSEHLTEKDLQTIFQYTVLKSASSVEEVEKRNASLKEMIAASIWNIIECTDLFGFNEIIDALMPKHNKTSVDVGSSNA